jgi:hypothetical protein
MALMLVSDVNRPLEALPYLRSLLAQYPDHTKGLILMGDLNVNHLKDLNAAEQVTSLGFSFRLGLRFLVKRVQRTICGHSWTRR